MALPCGDLAFIDATTVERDARATAKYTFEHVTDHLDDNAPAGDEGLVTPYFAVRSATAKPVSWSAGPAALPAWAHHRTLAAKAGETVGVLQTHRRHARRPAADRRRFTPAGRLGNFTDRCRHGLVGIARSRVADPAVADRHVRHTVDEYWRACGGNSRLPADLLTRVPPPPQPRPRPGRARVPAVAAPRRVDHEQARRAARTRAQSPRSVPSPAPQPRHRTRREGGQARRAAGNLRTDPQPRRVPAIGARCLSLSRIPGPRGRRGRP